MIEDLGNLFHGFAVVLQPYNIMLMFIGILLGVIIGVLPGLGGANGVAMAATVSIGTVIAIYLMFEKWFLVPLPKGPIEDFFGL